LISGTARIFPKVHLGKDIVIEDFVVLGKPPTADYAQSKPLTVGDRSVIRCGTIIYAGTKIGNDFTTGDYAKIRENNVIGDNASIGSNTIIERDSVIGNDVRIHSNCFIPEYTMIEDAVWIGPCVVVANVLHPPCPIFKKDIPLPRPTCLTGPTFRKGSIVGAGAIILPWIEVGERSLIGAGAVVCDNVPPQSVVIGSPARVHGSIKDLGCPPGYYSKGEIYSWRP